MASPPLPPAQSVNLDVFENAVAALMYAGTALCPTNYDLPDGGGPNQLDPSKIIEWYGAENERPTIEGEQILTYGIYSWLPDAYAGAGRLASTGKMSLRITVWTRFAVDRSGVQYAIFRTAQYGHWLRWFQMANAFTNNTLNLSYDANLTATGTPLGWEPFQPEETKFIVLKSPKDPTWVYSPLTFSIAVSLPILQPPIPS